MRLLCAPHSIAAQMFLRNLKEPLIPFGLYDEALQAARTQDISAAVRLYDQVAHGWFHVVCLKRADSPILL